MVSSSILNHNSLEVCGENTTWRETGNISKRPFWMILNNVEIVHGSVTNWILIPYVILIGGYPLIQLLIPENPFFLSRPRRSVRYLFLPVIGAAKPPRGPINYKQNYKFRRPMTHTEDDTRLSRDTRNLTRVGLCQRHAETRRSKSAGQQQLSASWSGLFMGPTQGSSCRQGDESKSWKIYRLLSVLMKEGC